MTDGAYIKRYRSSERIAAHVVLIDVQYVTWNNRPPFTVSSGSYTIGRLWNDVSVGGGSSKRKGTSERNEFQIYGTTASHTIG